MKKALKTIVILIICCICIASFASCSGGIKGEDAKALINEFFTAVAAENYQKAEALLHPDLDVDLEESLRQIENGKNVDFQKGVKIERYTGFRSAIYSSSVSGSSYELTMKAKIGDRSVEIEVAIVKNDNGYGIYSFYLY